MKDRQAIDKTTGFASDSLLWIFFVVFEADYERGTQFSLSRQRSEKGAFYYRYYDDADIAEKRQLLSPSYVSFGFKRQIIPYETNQIKESNDACRVRMAESFSQRKKAFVSFRKVCNAQNFEYLNVARSFQI